MMEASTMPTRAIVIQNPTAGQGNWQEQIRAALQTFQRAGWEVTLRETTGQGDATRLAKEAVEEGRDIVVVAGGDGTVNEALQGLAEQTHTALAVLPGGTVNVWATELGSGDAEADIAARIVAGRRRRIDIGRVNDRYFMMMASTGFDAETSALVADSPELKKVKRRVGPLAYALAAVQTLRTFRGRRLRLEIDGQAVQRRALMVIVGNTRLYGGIAQITYQAHADDGSLDLCVLTGQGPLDLARRLVAVILRRQRQDDNIDYQKVRRVTINTVDTTRPLRVQADGEDVGETPVTLEVIPAALEVIVFPDAPPGFLSGADESGADEGERTA
jgi:YegS/Rv2252/BmrU family lipid kinase